MIRARAHTLSNVRGALLIDALIALALVVTVTAGVAHLLVWARRSVWSAGARSVAVVAATQKIEQLRSMPWFVDVNRLPVSDETTDLSTPRAEASGTGLRASPGGTLDASSAGFVDYIGRDGLWCGTGRRPPATAVFVRRWAVQPLPSDPADSVVITVVVLPVTDLRSPAASRRGVRLTSIRSRTSG